MGSRSRGASSWRRPRSFGRGDGSWSSSARGAPRPPGRFRSGHGGRTSRSSRTRRGSAGSSRRDGDEGIVGVMTRPLTEALLPVEDALRIVLGEVAPLGEEEVDLVAVRGRVLAETLVAPEDIPASPRSAMDGYAVRAADVATTPALLEVVGFLPAGRDATGITVDPGRAVRIMTGAMVPKGADAVQMLERTETVDEGRRVRLLAPVAV